MPHKSLVLDGNQRSALAVIRSLGRRGQHVVVADHRQPTLGGASRYSTATAQYPDPATQPAQFVECVASIVRQFDIGTVIPTTDLSTMLLTAESARFEGTRLACPPAKAYEVLTDKRSLVQLASSLGVLIPETRVTRSIEETLDAVRHLGYPLVLKPSRSRYVKDNAVLSTAVQIVRNAAQLPFALGRIAWLNDIPCLVQEFIPGHGAGIFALYDAGSPIAWFSHKRIREKPPSGGVSVLSESAIPKASMKAAAAQLLSAARWSGVAMVEFRVADTGIPYLMEVNGRFWGSLQLAIDCGIDFPWLLYQSINGVSPEAPTPDQRVRRLRWLLGDLDNLLIQVGSEQLGIRAKAAAVVRFAGAFFDPISRQEIFRVSDPWPALHELSTWIRALRH